MARPKSDNSFIKYGTMLPAEMIAKINEISSAESISQNEVIRRALDHYFEYLRKEKYEAEMEYAATEHRFKIRFSEALFTLDIK